MYARFHHVTLAFYDSSVIMFDSTIMAEVARAIVMKMIVIVESVHYCC